MGKDWLVAPKKYNFTEAQKTPKIKFKFSLSQNTHKVLCSHCSLKQTNL